MQLTIDLRFAAPPLPERDGERVVTLAELAANGRRLRALLRLLRGERYETTRVIRDARRLNGVQAGALGLAALSRAGRYTIEWPHESATFGQAALLARATATFATAFPTEAARAALAGRRARAVAAR